MSYNTRRTGPTTPNVGNIGQRRPVVTNNFVAGGQLNAQNKAGVQVPNQQAQRTPQPGNTGVNFRNQNQGYQTTTAQQPVQKIPQQQQAHPPQQQVHPAPQPQPQVQVKPEQPAPILPGANPPNPLAENNANGDESMDTSDTPKKKPFWAKGGKISKKEKMRRRNLRLSKMLQPKNAVMILNELVKNTSYMVEELQVKTDTNQFKASVMVEDIEHVGYGRSKIHAKNSAAETALKHFIKTNKLSEMKKDEEGNEKMDVSEDGTQPPLPWQHVASFALYKLFTSWGEDPNKAAKVQPSTIADGEPQKAHENRPAKKMPDNPETMNPLMLINQMLPQAQFEEIGKTGAPPNVMYSYRCIVNGETFMGTGSNKKAAKKMAAFGACHKILNIQYPADVYVPGF